jgi:Leucine-rich repeat (LRR) protein
MFISPILSKTPMTLLRFIILLLIIGCCNSPGSTITELDLSNQKLTAIPDSVFTLTQLEYLELGNEFTFYPPFLVLGRDDGDSANKISVIPKAIENLQNLKVLGIRFVGLESIPAELYELKKLDTLLLSFNDRLNISAAMPTLGRMTWLKYLDIMATSFQQEDIDSLKLLLPNTEIVTAFERPEDLKN